MDDSLCLRGEGGGAASVFVGVSLLWLLVAELLSLKLVVVFVSLDGLLVDSEVSSSAHALLIGELTNKHQRKFKLFFFCFVDYFF